MNIVFNTSTELLRIPLEAIVYILADGNYSAIRTADGSEYVLTLQIGHIEEMLSSSIPEDNRTFIRIGKSLIANRNYITLINPSQKRLVLSDCLKFRHDVSASRDALKSVKEYLESEAKK